MPFFSQLWEIGLSPQLNPHPPPPHTQPHCLYPSAVTSLPIHSGPRLQCFFNSYFWPTRGSLGGPWNPSITALVSFAGNWTSAFFLELRIFTNEIIPGLPVQTHVTMIPKSRPTPPPPYCMSTTWLVVILFVFPNNPNNHQEEGWKWMERNKNVAKS